MKKTIVYTLLIILIIVVLVIIFINSKKNDNNRSVLIDTFIKINNTVYKINDIPENLQDNGIFKNYYFKAYNKLKTLSLDEKIGQIFLVRVPATNKINTITDYKIGGYLLFQRDFDNKTKNDVINMIKEFQDNSSIPLLIASDEEGGTVTRISNNHNLVDTPFKSPQYLYNKGGLSLIEEDTINKSKILNELGINLNLAPVVDVSTNPNDYMYKRSLGKNALETSKFAETVIKASKNTNVSYTLKHFPGYGNNVDTHTKKSIDDRSYNDIMNNDILPFKLGIDAGAKAILISHNIVTSIDSDNPASLSPNIHNLLRNELNFTGITITDDLDMQAISKYANDNAVIKAILAGNDLLIVTDYKKSIQEVKDAINNQTLSEDLIDKLAFRIIAWKYYKRLIKD